MSKKKEKLISAIEQADDRLIEALTAAIDQYRPERPEEPKQLFRLVYTSARSKHCNSKEIDKILEKSRNNNAKLGITGILIYTKDRFLQVLEGEKEKINKLYKTIEEDDRHGAPILRFCESVSKRYFEGWDMAGKKMGSNEMDFKTSVSGRKKQLLEAMLNGDSNSYEDEGMIALKTFLLFS
ncbi:MAG: BLUF domain-containing protein [Ekhidna sp.]|nr:BLUF domain-containing protein [Ekhidna sp.]